MKRKIEVPPMPVYLIVALSESGLVVMIGVEKATKSTISSCSGCMPRGLADMYLPVALVDLGSSSVCGADCSS